MKTSRLILAMGLCMISIVASAKVNGYHDKYIGHGPTMPPDPWEPILIKHGPTMPPGPDEPFRLRDGPSPMPSPIPLNN